MTTSRPTAIAIITHSTGELHCLLPLLRLAKEALPELHIVVIFRRLDTRARFEEDHVYAAVLADLGAEVGHAGTLLRHLAFNRQNIRIIFKEFGPTPKGCLPAWLKRACPNAWLVLFPHAYSLYGSDQQAPTTDSADTQEKYDQSVIDVLLVNSQLDVGSWSKRLAPHKIRVAGATGYTAWWGDILRDYATKHLKVLTAAAHGQRLVLLTTRGPHDLYLTKENYEYLVVHALKTILSYPDTRVLLKPHPREEFGPLKALLKDFPSDRVMLVGFNTLALASISTVTVSFWSSALLDSLATGTPGIEFYRFHRPNPQTVLDAEGQIASFYTDLGLAVPADSAAKLSEALQMAFADPKALLARERQALSRCYPDNEAQIAVPRGLFAELLRAAPARPGDSLLKRCYAWLKVTQLLLQELFNQRAKRGYNAN